MEKIKNDLIINFIRFNADLVEAQYLKAKESLELSSIYDTEWNSTENFSVFFHLETNSDYLSGYTEQILSKGHIKYYPINIGDIKILDDINLNLWLNKNYQDYPNVTHYIFALESLKLAMMNNLKNILII